MMTVQWGKGKHRTVSFWIYMYITLSGELLLLQVQVTPRTQIALSDVLFFLLYAVFFSFSSSSLCIIFLSHLNASLPGVSLEFRIYFVQRLYVEGSELSRILEAGQGKEIGNRFKISIRSNNCVLPMFVFKFQIFTTRIKTLISQIKNKFNIHWA